MEGFSRRILVLAWLAAACSADPKGGGGGGTTTTPLGGSTNCGAQLTEGAAAGAGGRISFSLAAGTDPCSVQGYVVGQQGTTSAARTGENEFVIEDVPEGDRDIIVTGTPIAPTTTVEPADTGGANLQAPAAGVIGIRVNELEVVAGASLTKTLRLGAVGSIRGNAKLAGQADHTGIQVYVPGTSYAARTDAAGNFEIAQVVPGRHNLRFEFTGYGHALLEGVDVLPAGVGTAPAVVLFTGGGEGKIAILADDGSVRTEPLPVLSSRIVRYALQVQGAPRLMKISEDGNFANVEWQPFRSSGSYTFKVDPTSGGRLSKKLSVRTLDGTTENEIDRAVVIDLFPEARAAGLLAVSTKDAAGTPILGLRATLTLPKNSVEMRLSTRSDFAGAAWETVAVTKTLPVTEEGEFVLYAQFRDVDLIASDVFAAVGIVDLFPAGSLAFTVSTPVVSFPAAPEFALTEIASPIKSEHVKLLLADNEAMVGAQVLPYTATHTLALDGGSKITACGTRTLRLMARFTDPATGKVFTSDVAATQSLRYRCTDTIAGAEGQPRHRSAVATGGQWLLDWSGYARDRGDKTGSSRILANGGALYDTVSKTWSPVSGANAPYGRVDARTWYSGGKFVVFGGELPNVNNGAMSTEEFDVFDGGIYDPVTDQWTLIPEPPPHPLGALTVNDTDVCDEFEDQAYVPHFTMVGNALVLWGQTINRQYCPEYVFTFIYKPGSGWTSFATPSTSIQTRCSSPGTHAPVQPWIVAGSRLVTWGGRECADEDSDNHFDLLTGGEVLDVSAASPAWVPMATSGAPADRVDYAATWTGTEVLVWGGRVYHSGSGTYNYTGMTTGAIYNPATNAWRAMAASPAGTDLAGRDYYAYEHIPHQPAIMRTLFAGNKMLVWGGEKGQIRTWRGMTYSYDPTGLGSWATIPASGAPGAIDVRQLDKNGDSGSFAIVDDAFAFDGKMYVWKRAVNGAQISDTASLFTQYDPATNQWTRMPLGTADLDAGTRSSFYRNFPYVVPAGDGVIFFRGSDPEAAKWGEAPHFQGGVFHKLK